MTDRRNTNQRRTVLETVHNMRSHPTADEVYEQAREDNPSIGRATVYRNLNTLSELGKLRHIPMPDGADCYDHRLDGHYHIRCVHCRRVFDARLPFMEELTALAQAQEEGFALTGHFLSFEGICPACQAAEGMHTESKTECKTVARDLGTFTVT